MDEQILRASIEAIFYVAEEPVTLDQLREAFPTVDPIVLERGLEWLKQSFAAPDRGLALREVGGGWRLSTRVECHEAVRAFLRTKPGFKLSMAALETLAIIAYRQPVTIPEVMQIRGVKSAGAVRTLLEKKLIAPRGRRKALGAPMQYGTSREFLVHFGMGSLKDLPTIDEFEEIFGDKAEKFQQKTLFDTKLEGITASVAGEDGLTEPPPETPLIDDAAFDAPADDLPGEL